MLYFCRKSFVELETLAFPKFPLFSLMLMTKFLYFINGFCYFRRTSDLLSSFSSRLSIEWQQRRTLSSIVLDRIFGGENLLLKLVLRTKLIILTLMVCMNMLFIEWLSSSCFSELVEVFQGNLPICPCSFESTINYLKKPMF